MAFTSFGFLVFLFVVVVLYYLVPKRFQWCLLLVASYTFYLFSGVEQVVFLIGTTLINYGAARVMQGIRDRGRAGEEGLTKEAKREHKKQVNREIHTIQTITIVVDLAILIVVKYLNFLIGNVNALFSLFRFNAEVPLVNIIAPLGISFYLFTSMGYLIDVGRGRYEAEKNIGKFALFVSFFPSVVQGPINRFNDVGKQLVTPHAFSYDNLCYGSQLILWGFFKKLVVADRIACFPNKVYSGGEFVKYSGSVCFVAIVFYAIQLYCDFSGGIDIARGAAQIMGIDLPENFQRPYFSTTVSEYWRRWHMSLGAWMREYVFYPITLSKPFAKLGKFARKHMSPQLAKVLPSALASFVVFFLVGIWHGANWRYVGYGLYNGMLVGGGVALTPYFAKLNEKLGINTGAWSWKVFQIVRTFLLTLISKLMTRSFRLVFAFSALKRMITDIDLDFLFGVSPQWLKFGLNQRALFVMGASVAIVFVVSLLQERGIRMRETIAKQNVLFRWGVWLVLLTIVLVFGMYGPSYNASDFLYQVY